MVGRLLRPAKKSAGCTPGVASDGLRVPPDVVVQQLRHQVDGLDEQVQEGVEAAAVRDLEVALHVLRSQR